MRTKEDIESFFIRMDAEAQEIEDGLWVLEGDEGGPHVVVNYSPPVVVLRLKVMEMPDAEDAQLAGLYRRMLELNATDIVHGSYGIEEGDIVLSDALELETLDFQELRSSYESMMFAASSHHPRLAALVPAAHEG